MEGLPWAHWKGSWQDDKASMSLQLSIKVKHSLNLIAPEKKKTNKLLQVLPKRIQTTLQTSLSSWGFHREQGSSQR